MKFWDNTVQSISSNWLLLVQVWVIAVAAGYAFLILPIQGDIIMSFKLDSGLAALLGALIGSGTTILFGIWQSKTQAVQNRKNALFDARRSCYAEVIAHFTVAGIELGRGNPFPVKEEDTVKHHRIMSELLLLSDKEVAECREIFIAKIAEVINILKVGKNASKQINELKNIQIKMRSAMKRELGLH